MKTKIINTVTLNPAIDRTVLLDNFKSNDINRVKRSVISAGGKGINVAKIINFQGGEARSLGFLGGETGKKIKSILDENKIKNDFIWTKSETRTNIKIVDEINQICTDINEAGASISDDDLQKLLSQINELDDEMLVLSGSAQPGISKNIYKDIIEQNPFKKIILDASGELLSNAINCKIFLIKPNKKELSECLHQNLNSNQEIINACKDILSKGISNICVSLGEDGLLFINSKKIIQAIPPKVIAKSTVGAGDSVVGSLAHSFSINENLEEALKKACAVSVASVLLEGTEVPTKQSVNEIYSKIKIISENI